MGVFGFQDLLMGPLVLILLYLFTYTKQQRKLLTHPEYKYFTRGLTFSLLGTVGFILIYTFYYPGGDTTDLHAESIKLSNLFHKNPLEYLETLFSRDDHTRSFFTNETGFPKGRYWDDRTTYNMVRMISVLQLLFFKSYVGISFILSYLSFLGTWYIFKIFSQLKPKQIKWWFFSILCFPSTLFWASGINKESLTLFFFGLSIVTFYNILSHKKHHLKNYLILLIGLWGLLNIKSYIVVALLPTFALWATREQVQKIKNSFVRLVITPTALLFFLGLAFVVYGSLGDYLGTYGSIDSMVTEASIRQHDLKQDYYKGNAFDIGDYETSVSGLLSAAPQAIIAGFYRPFPWEVSKVVDGLSGLENLILIILSFIALFRFSRSVKIILSYPFLLFCISFSLIYAFSIGVSTSNFGALVRFKVIMLPLFVPFLTFIWQEKRK